MGVGWDEETAMEQSVYLALDRGEVLGHVELLMDVLWKKQWIVRKEKKGGLRQDQKRVFPF